MLAQGCQVVPSRYIAMPVPVPVPVDTLKIVGYRVTVYRPGSVYGQSWVSFNNKLYKSKKWAEKAKARAESAGEPAAIITVYR